MSISKQYVYLFTSPAIDIKETMIVISMRIISNMKKDIKSYSFSELTQLCKDCGQPTFRSKQLIHWLYRIGVSSYDEMTNLPKTFREKINEIAPLYPSKIIDKQISKDGTRKYVIEYHDGARVEAVGMPSSKSLSVCFSTQAGCAMECVFCATGTEGLTRNLTSGEMIDQLLLVQNDFQTRISHVVTMGQGEPFQNYDAVLETLRFLNTKDGFEIGARHITLSTCGIISGIEKLSNEPEQFTLAISLHSARQEIRNKLMPRCSSLPLPQLKESLLQYITKTGRRVSFEYLMIKGINDTKQDLDALKEFCESLLCHINLIPINSVDHSPYQPSSKETMKHWVSELTSIHKETTIRNSRGSDIDGACGQLKNKLSK